MKDAIGGSLLLNLVVIFTSIIILFFAGILAYSKAYKVKNKIIEIIESNDGEIVENGVLKTSVKTALKTELSSVGYMVSEAPSEEKCKRHSSRGICTNNLNDDNFNYCICLQNTAESLASTEGQTYEVITYVHFAFPVIGDLLTFPVKGETRILGKNYDY